MKVIDAARGLFSGKMGGMIFYVMDGKTYAEIAGELGITVNTVKSHVAKAYRDLRAAAVSGTAA